MHVPLTLNGTMSGFTCKKPTFAEVSDPEGADVKVVHMTSDAPWDPQTAENTLVPLHLFRRAWDACAFDFEWHCVWIHLAGNPPLLKLVILRELVLRLFT